MTTQRFKALVAQLGTRTVIVLPFNPHEVWGQKQVHHVTGSVSGCAVRGTLDSDGTQFFLPVGAAWRRDNGLEVGVTVDVVLSPEGPQFDQLSPDVATALESDPEAKAFFEGLATYYRKGYINGIEGAKRPETRAKRLDEMMELLKAGKKQK